MKIFYSTSIIFLFSVSATQAACILDCFRSKQKKEPVHVLTSPASTLPQQLTVDTQQGHTPSSSSQKETDVIAAKGAAFLADVQQRYDAIFKGKKEIPYDETNMPQIKSVAEFFREGMFQSAIDGADISKLQEWTNILLLNHIPLIVHKELQEFAAPSPSNKSAHEPPQSPRLSDALPVTITASPFYQGFGTQQTPDEPT